MPLRCNNPPSPWARVNVAVRVRPLNERESETVQHRLRCVGDDRCLGLNPKAVAESVNFRGQQACAGVVKPHKDYTFMFDKVFGEDKNSKYNCERTTKEMLTTLLDGYYCSVFAYGATGTGKTFTMLGSEDCPGLVSLTASELYRCVDRLRSNSQSCDVAVAYMEVCNEVVRDLLCPKGPSLVVRDDPAKSIAISNLSIHNTENVTSTSKEIRVSKVSFVDLAGSERVAAGNKDIKDQIREGTKVHLSLLTLGNCFDALSKGGAQWVPYQDSKVTHILKDSLGGTCRTLLMAFVSPSKLSYTDTHNTLKYAVRAMKIELQAQKKVHNVNAHTPMYSSLVEEYKRKVEGLQRKLDKAENEKSKLEIQVVELKKSLATAKDALLQDQHTDAGSIVPASHNDALSTTSVLSLTIEANERSDDSRTAYFSTLPERSMQHERTSLGRNGKTKTSFAPAC
ncbi:hypothetical protein HPB51_029199 [Rhipicephalus microplus]|uniref:Kinesin-like protein n=1 Tax=Rhipicephalus microplus TaxID=6941 RepID=A0A9J6CUX2_RHIMP|nr:hypothetical protein HPB51_029199 [Rhipicephalus microplus]